MKKINFSAIKQHSLANTETIVRQWLPEGSRQGAEWVALNPTRPDSKAGSFSVNLNSGIWKDFATDDGGSDLVSLVAYVENIGQTQAAKKLATFLGLSDNEVSTAVVSRKQNRSKTFKAIFPPPVEALNDCPTEHPTLGRPSHFWDYLSPEGNLLMRVMRFDKVNNGITKKDFRPLSYGKLDNQPPNWCWRQLPKDRPLYRLEHYKKQQTTLVCEGEKAADAAVALFPDFFVTTWSGGAKAINKTDFSPIANQNIIVWSDNDDAGTQAQSELIKALHNVGINKIRIINMEFFANYMAGKHGELDTGGNWPHKADAFDATKLGWTAQHMDYAIKKGLLFTNIEKTASHENCDRLPPGYTMDEKGLCYYGKKICDQIKIVARTRSGNGVGRNWGLLVHFEDFDGQQKQWNIPMQAFATNHGTDIIRGLLERGLQIKPSHDAKRALLEYLQEYHTPNRISLAYKMGWHNEAFVLPDMTIGASDPVLFYSERPLLCKLNTKGSLDGWIHNVAKYCSGNPLALMAVSSPLSGPLLEIMGYESIGFHFYGDSSWGKSTLLNLACSVLGDPETYKRTFRTTDNALEGLAASHSDMLLALDEINQIDPRSLGEVIYMLGNGQGKHRANDRGQALEQENRWRLTYLTNGEKPLAQYLSEGGKKSTGGMEMRFIGIYATRHVNETDKKKMGVFDTSHEMDGGAALSQHLKREMSRHHGLAFPEFIKRLVDIDRTELQMEILNFTEQFVSENCTGEAGGQVQRVAAKFALAGYAGELATRLGITGWKPSEASSAASACFQSWLTHRGGEGNIEDKQILKNIKLKFALYGESNFKRWDKTAERTNTIIAPSVHSPAKMWGFRQPLSIRCSESGNSQDNIYYVYPTAFENEICEGHDPVRVARLVRPEISRHFLW